MVIDGTEEQVTGINNAPLSSRETDREMNARREEIVHTMWEDFIKE